MSALVIKRIDNPKHVQRVLRARVALRIVPPSEGVWVADETLTSPRSSRQTGEA